MKLKKLLFACIVFFSIQLTSQIGFQETIITGESYATRWPKEMITADVDGDNDLDIIVSGSGLKWYENIDGKGHFGEANLIQEGSSSDNFLRITDLDNDNDVDIVQSIGNKIKIFKNVDGFGNFQLIQTLEYGTNFKPGLIAVNDINVDGDKDIVLYYQYDSWPYEGRLLWLENDGSGNFVDSENIIQTFSEQVSVLAMGDVNGDQLDDIVVGYSGEKEIACLKNSGTNGGFESIVEFTTAYQSLNRIYLGDLDGDKDLDIATMSKNDEQIQWYENKDGLGDFGNEAVLFTGIDSPKYMSFSDLNGDELIDVVYTSGNEIKTHLNLGSGNFGNHIQITNKAYDARTVIVADLDGDSKNDILSASYEDDKVAWYRNVDNSGSFSNQLVIGRRAEFPFAVYPADFDGDGDIDLLTNSQHDAKLSWVENVNGKGFYSTQHIVTENPGTGNSTPYTYPLDVDGDNDMDIAVSHKGILKWYENTDGLGTFDVEHIINDQGSGATIIRAGDIDDDGDTDLIFGFYSANKIFWHENVNGVFGPERLIRSGGSSGSITSLEIADFNGDDKLDVIGSSFNTGMFLYYNSDGLGNFQKQQMSTFDSMKAIYPSDIDGDGDNDIIGVDNNGGGSFVAVAWYENDNGVFNKQHDISKLSIHGESIHSVDLDNDGDMDVLTASGHSNTSGKLSWYENIDGKGNFAERQIIHELFNNSIARYVNAADVDNDGDKDVLVAYGYFSNSSVSKVSVFKNLGENRGNFITGLVRLDENNDGCDGTDLPMSSFMISSISDSDSFATFPQKKNGFYNMALSEGTFTTRIENLPNYFTSSPVSKESDFTGFNTTEELNFCIQKVNEINDLNIAVYPSINEPRPGFDTTYKIVYKNFGSTALSGDIIFEFNNSKIQFLTSSEAIKSQTENTLTFSFDAIKPFETRIVNLNFNVFAPPVTNIGDVLTTKVSLVIPVTDATEKDNQFELNQDVIGSYDPNDIRVLEGDEILISEIDDYLHYIIRFQNTGNADAINVKVNHILDEKLDWKTMQLESLSHSGVVEVIGERNVNFVFDNIYLTDSTSDEPNSHGYIAFKIKLKNDVVVGNIINGVADIYFDFNPAITTNTVGTEIKEPTLSVSDIEKKSTTLFPNPSKDLLHIQSDIRIESFVVFDIHGRTVLSSKNIDETNKFNLDVKGLAKGVYILQVTSDNIKQSFKFIKE